MERPLVSVVMGVRNGGEDLKRTIDSVLDQKDISLEFIIVNDGSTDNTSAILDQVKSKDERVTVLNRAGRGLTLSLIEACDLARGEFIARQDANDYSLPGRLAAQAKQLIKHKDSSMCSTLVRFKTREGAVVFSTIAKKYHQGGLSGIIHGSVMMRRSMYIEAGGYRPQFYYAQDVDLWSRLYDIGCHIEIPTIYYEGMLFPESISGSKKDDQERLFRLIQKATNARRNGQNEQTYLDLASDYSQKCRISHSSRRGVASGAYFIGACILASNPELAKLYFQKAVDIDPTHIRARLKLVELR